MSAYEKLANVAPGEGPLDELLAALQEGTTLDSHGTFTLDREKAREKMQRFQLAQPARYILELVQAAVLRGAPSIYFEISATDVHLRCQAAPFTVDDYENIYEALFSRSMVSQRQALRHLALGLCTAMSMNPKRVRVTGGGAQGGALTMKPGKKDQFGKQGGAEYGIHIHLERSPWVVYSRSILSAAMDDIEKALLLDLCGLSMVPIEVNGMPIASGYQIPGALYWSHFKEGNTRGVVAVAQGEGLHARATSLHLLRNCISFEEDHPPELLPGFKALIESPSFHLDISHKKIVRNEAYEQALRLVLYHQIQQIVRDAEKLCQGKWQHGPVRMRELLFGLLNRLGSADPVARWAGMSGHFVTPAPREFPESVPGAIWLLQVPVFQALGNRMVSLAQILTDLQRHGTLMLSSSDPTPLRTSRPLVLLATGPATEFYARIFSGRIEMLTAGNVDGERSANIERWRKRRQEPKLLSPPNLLRVGFPENGPWAGEVAIELPSSAAPAVETSPQLSLTLLHLRGVLSVSELPCPIRGLHAIVSGEFTPNQLWDGVHPDAKLAAAVEQLMCALPILGAAIVLERHNLLSSPSVGEVLRQAVRGLFVFAGSPLSQHAMREALGLPMALTLSPALQRELQEILHTREVYAAPLLEGLFGETLSLHDLETEFMNRGALCVVAISAPSAADRRLRHDWAERLRPGEVPDALWRHAASQWPSLKNGRPAFIVWFEGSLEWLRELLGEAIAQVRVEDVRPGLAQLAQLHAALREETQQLARRSRIDPQRTLAVPLDGLGGFLALRSEDDARPCEPFIDVVLTRDGEPPLIKQCPLPGGSLLQATVDASTLARIRGTDHYDLTHVRKALSQALLPLIERSLSDDSLVSDTIKRRFYHEVVTALFPTRAFRLNYERLCWLAASGAQSTERVEEEHRTLLAFATRRSAQVVSTVLEQLLRERPNEPAFAQDVKARLQSKPQAGSSDDRSGPDSTAAQLISKVLRGGEHGDDPGGLEPAPGALDYLEQLFPECGLSFDDGALRPHAILRRVPLWPAPDGSLHTVGDVLAEVYHHGDVLILPPGVAAPDELASQRRLLAPQDAQQSSALYCLLGEFRLRTYVPPESAEEVDEEEPARPALASQPHISQEAAAVVIDMEAEPESAKVTEHASLENSGPAAERATSSVTPILPIEITAAPIPDDVPKLKRSPIRTMIKNAAAVVIKVLTRHQARRAALEAQVLAKLLEELRLIAGPNDALLSQINLSRIRFDVAELELAVACSSHQTVINRRHPAVKRALQLGPSDPVAMWFLSAAVYTALNIFFLEVTDEDEAQFLSLLCRRADSLLSRMAPKS